MKDTLQALWDQRNSREKILLAVAGALFAVFLLYSILWAPAANGRADLQARLPQLQSQLARMSAEADEARTLKVSSASATPRGQALLDGLQASLAQQGLAGAQLSGNGRLLQLQIKDAPFNLCVSWLDQARRTYKLQVIEAKVTALPRPGEVAMSATLQSISP